MKAITAKQNRNYDKHIDLCHIKRIVRTQERILTCSNVEIKSLNPFIASLNASNKVNLFIINAAAKLTIQTKSVNSADQN